jgi:hypothetical protein
MNSISDRVDYKNVCIDSVKDESKFDIFKRNPSYNGILEHVSKEQGELYLRYLDSNFTDYKEYLEIFKGNDLYGGSVLSEYDNVGEISPSTLRYIKVLSDIKNLFGDLNGKKIIEIGAGYGGQCFITSKYFKLKEYGLIDLDEVLSLSEKYLNKLDIEHRIINIDSVSSLDEEFDLVISNYAYSELNKELQDLYYDKIISRSKNGYLTLNFISHLYGINSYSKEELLNKMVDKNPKIMEEYPNTYEKNIIIHF